MVRHPVVAFTVIAYGISWICWLPLLADKPIILAMANPEPEILPELARSVRPDAIVATGRASLPDSDHAETVKLLTLAEQLEAAGHLELRDSLA